MPVEPPTADWGLLARPSEPAPAVVVFPAQDRGRWWLWGLVLAAAAIGAVLAVSLAGGSSAPAQAAAAAINLRLSDLPGFAASVSGGPGASLVAAAAERCTAAPAGSAPALASPAFQEGGAAAQQFAQSSVIVAGSPSAADAAVRVLDSPSAAGCLVAALRPTTAGGQAISFAATHVQQLPFAAAGVDAGYADAVTATMTSAAGGVPLSLEIVGFVAGSTEVTLTTAALGPPFPASLSARLESLLVARALPHGAPRAPVAPSPTPTVPAPGSTTAAG